MNRYECTGLDSPSAEDFDRVWKEMDEDKSGGISFEEFENFLTRVAKGTLKVTVFYCCSYLLRFFVVSIYFYGEHLRTEL